MVETKRGQRTAQPPATITGSHQGEIINADRMMTVQTVCIAAMHAHALSLARSLQLALRRHALVIRRGVPSQ